MKKLALAVLGLMLTASTAFSATAADAPVITFVCQENPNGNWNGGIVKVINFSNGNEVRVQVTSLDSYRIRRQALPGQTSCESAAEQMNKQLMHSEAHSIF